MRRTSWDVAAGGRICRFVTVTPGGPDGSEPDLVAVGVAEGHLAHAVPVGLRVTGPDPRPAAACTNPSRSSTNVTLRSPSPPRSAGLACPAELTGRAASDSLRCATGLADCCAHGSRAQRRTRRRRGQGDGRLVEHTDHRRARPGRRRAGAHRAGRAAAPAARLGACADPGRPARDGRGAALRRPPRLPYGGHRRRAGRGPDQERLRGCAAPPRRDLRPGRRRPPRRPGERARRQRPSHGHEHRLRGDPAGSRRHACASTACPPARRTWRSGCRTTRSPSWSRCAPTPRRSRCPATVAGCGCTTAARSATARTPRARPRPGPRWPRRSAVWSWSTWGSGAARCSTRSPRGPCGTRPRT